MENCAVCGKISHLKCSNCSSKYYCSKEHQRIDWKNVHKNECKSFEIVSNQILGRYLTARRDIKAGEVILREAPSIIGPKTSSVVICLGCHKTMAPPASGDFYKCSKCSWPVCGEGCESSLWHVDECRLMKEKNFKCSIRNVGKPKIEACYCVIAPLRVLLLKRSNPKTHQEITKLVSHLKERIETKLYAALKVNLVPFIRNFLKFSEITEAEILQIAGILDTNSFDIVLPQIKARGIYLTAAMISHDCVSNTKHFVDSNMELRLISSVDIKKGETITISYSHPLKTTIERRHQIKEAKCFDCDCCRCTDATEMGTFASGLKCRNCSNGILIPSDFTDDSAKWQCVDCKFTLLGSQALQILEQTRSALERLNKKSIAACENFLTEFDSIIPPRSVFNVEVKLALCLLYGNVPGFMIEELSKIQIARKRELCEQTIDVLKILEPGISNSITNASFELSVAKIAQLKRQLTEKVISRDEAFECIAVELQNIEKFYEILFAGSEGKSVLKDRLDRITKQSQNC